jgi:hypothetical protein
MRISFEEFKRQCYLKSTPSVDLNDVTIDNPIDCCDYKLQLSVYNDLLRGNCENNDEVYACDIWMLQSGPQLKED